MKAIKESRAIIILLALYIFISICVVILNQSKESKSKKEEETKEVTFSSFISNVKDVRTEINSYLNDVEVYDGTCLSLSSVLDKEVDGSVLIEDGGQTLTTWYKEDSYAINGKNIMNIENLSESEIDTDFADKLYNSCGK